MTLCRRTSTPSCSARVAALGSGRTLKAMMTALEAEASSTSVSLIAPTPAWTILTLTFSVLNFSSCSLKASPAPPTSAFRISGSSLTVPAWSRSCNWLKVRRESRGGGAPQRRQAQSFDGGGGTGRRQHPPALVEHGAHLAEDRTDDEGVADAQ